MDRLYLIGLLWVVAIGCTTGADVVDGADADMLADLMRYEVETEDLHFQAADTEVYATLTVPEGEEMVPGVVLVAGSGPTDRDWNNPLLPGDNGTAIELSDRLARAGVAVLRYDKRGTGHTEIPDSVIWDDYLAEVEAAVTTLRQDERVDGDRIFLAGHSEGGAHALRAVVEERVEVDGLVLLATAGRSMRDLVLSGVDEQLRNAGMGQEARQAQMESLRRAMDSVSRGESVEASHVSEIPGIVSLVETLQAADARDFAAELLGWDPAPALREVRSPVLIIQGLKDTQLDAEADARRLYREASKFNEDVELALVEDADHVLKHQSIDGEELGPQHSLLYNDPSRNLDDAVFQALVLWVHAR